MMKRLIASFAALVLFFSATGCVGVGFSSYGGSHGGKGGDIQGSGVMSTLTFSGDDIRKLSINIPGELYYTVGEPGGRVELHANLMQYVSVSTGDNGTLTIDSDRSINIQNDKDMPKIYVSAPSLEALDINGVVTVKDMDTIASDSFTLDIDGVFNGTIDLAVKNLKVDLDGVGSVALTGTADNAVIDMSGVGNLNAFGLQTKVADIETSGVGNAEISCSEKLIAKVSSVGGIQYKGNPAVEPDISGIGGLKKVD